MNSHTWHPIYFVKALGGMHILEHVNWQYLEKTGRPIAAKLNLVMLLGKAKKMPFAQNGNVNTRFFQVMILWE